MEQLNERWRNGRASNKLHEAGVLVHTFDGLEDPEHRWQPFPGCSSSQSGCSVPPDLADRVSVSLINKGLTFGGRIKLFGAEASGLILRPYGKNCLLCGCEGGGLNSCHVRFD